MSPSSQEDCSVRSVGVFDLVKSGYRSDVEVVEAEFRVRLSEMGAWCGPARVGLVFSGLAGERGGREEFVVGLDFVSLAGCNLLDTKQRVCKQEKETEGWKSIQFPFIVGSLA